MHLISYLVWAVALVCLTGAAPVAHQSRHFASFKKITQVKNSNFSSRNGFAAYAKAAAKYNITTTSTTSTSGNVVGAVSLEAGSGTVVSNPAGQTHGVDQEYLCPVTVGNQQFHLDFDTGSADLWVSNMMACIIIVTNIFQIAGSGVSGASQTYTPSGAVLSDLSWDISYVDGTGASGDVYSEIVTIGGTTVTGQAVERATRASGNFFVGGSDGLLGLSFSSDNTVIPTKQNTFIDNAISQGMPAVFAANLQHQAAGSYDFGGVDPSSYSGIITFTPVDNSQGSWMVTSDSGDRGVMDTGTSLLLLSNDTASQYYAKVSSAAWNSVDQAWEYDCSETLPDFSMSFSGYAAIVPGSYINYANIDSTKCYGGIQPRGDLSFSLFGDIFLKSQYVVYDQTAGNPRLGLASKPLT